MKSCSNCKEEKPLTEFNKDKSDKKYGLQRICRQCNALLRREYYKKNKHKWKSYGKKYDRKNARRVSQRKLCEYLLANPCVDCGETDILVLEFDHLRDKCFNISRMILRSMSWEKIELEIAKCDVVCKNCHQRRTAKRGNYFKYKFLTDCL